LVVVVVAGTVVVVVVAWGVVVVVDGTVVVVVVAWVVVVVVDGTVVVVVVTTAAAVKESVRSARAVAPGGTFTSCPSPILSTVIVSLWPSWISTTLQVEPAGIP